MISDYSAMLAYLTECLPAHIPLRLDVCRTLTDAEGWLRWARRVVAAEGGGYALGVQKGSIGEVYEIVKRKEERGG